MHTPFVRRAMALVLVGYVAVLLFALLTPSGETPSSSISWVGERLRSLGAPERILVPERVEFLSNVAILVPATTLGALLARSTTWRDWTAYGFLFAGAIEVFQGVLLPERDATFVDVVANTLGALMGALVAMIVRMMDGASDI